MDKKTIVRLCRYYIGVLLVYICCLGLLSLACHIFNMVDNLRIVILVAYVLIFVCMSVIIVILMRLSRLEWYVDPLAAAEAPMILYCVMLINQLKHTGDLFGAFSMVSIELSDDGGIGYIFLAGLFVFGLIASFSPSKKRRKSR